MLNSEFCEKFNINQIDNFKNIPGILHGRYEGDVYAGGNPWVLSTSALSSIFYRCAIMLQNGYNMNNNEYKAWQRVLNYNDNLSNNELINTFKNAGDSVLYRV